MLYNEPPAASVLLAPTVHVGHGAPLADDHQKHRQDYHSSQARELRKLGATLVTEADTVKSWTANPKVTDTKAHAVAPATLRGIVKREYQITGGKFEAAPRSAAATATCPGCRRKAAKGQHEREHACANPKCSLHGRAAHRDAAASLNLALTRSKLNREYGLREARRATVLPANASDPSAGPKVVTTTLAAALAMRSPKQPGLIRFTPDRVGNV